MKSLRDVAAIAALQREQRARPQAERLLTCRECEDHGVRYRATPARGVVEIQVYPCTHCPAGVKRHGRPGESCRWLAGSSDERCPLCHAGPHTDGRVPIGWGACVTLDGTVTLRELAAWRPAP